MSGWCIVETSGWGRDQARGMQLLMSQRKRDRLRVIHGVASGEGGARGLSQARARELPCVVPLLAANERRRFAWAHSTLPYAIRTDDRGRSIVTRSGVARSCPVALRFSPVSSNDSSYVVSADRPRSWISALT